MLEYLLVATGGAFGSVLRYWMATCVTPRLGPVFLGTLLINISGSFIIGVFAALNFPSDGRWTGSHQFRNFFMVGICGGYTTFSSFSLQTLNLIKNGDWFWAGLNVLGSVLFCLVAVWLGYLLGSLFKKFLA